MLRRRSHCLNAMAIRGNHGGQSLGAHKAVGFKTKIALVA
jgi:hypothetical protein